MIPTDPNTAVSTLSSLYHSGAFVCMGIVVAYLALKVASTQIAWLRATPTRVHDVTVGLGILALFAGPASQGTTPTWTMLATSAPAIIALLLPGRTSSAMAVASSAAKVGLVMLLASAVSCATLKTMTGDFASCEGADLGKLVTDWQGQVVPFATAVAELIDDNPAGLEAWLAPYEASAIACAEAAYNDTHPAATGSGSAAAMVAVVQPGRARVDAVVAEKRKAGK